MAALSHRSFWKASQAVQGADGGLAGVSLETDRIYQGDCLELMGSLPANSVNLVYTDPPFFGVKDEAWDHQEDC